jgi:hypothetical protein
MQRPSPPRLVLIALVAAAVGFGVGYRSWIGAQARAVVALSTTLETPLLTWAVTGLTDEPRVEDVVVEGVPATLARQTRTDRLRLPQRGQPSAAGLTRTSSASLADSPGPASSYSSQTSPASSGAS